jgi:hypothetical protein
MIPRWREVRLAVAGSACILFHAAAVPCTAADDIRIAQAGTLRLPAEIQAADGTAAPLTGLSGLAWLGDDRWIAAVDNSDQLATFTLDLGPAGEPRAVAAVAMRPLAAHHDYEDIAVCPQGLLLCEEDTPAIRLFAAADGRELASIQLPAQLRACRGNRGLEAIAFDPAGSCIWTANEEAVPADGPAATATAGTVVRLARLSLPGSGTAAQSSRQFAYAVDPPHAAVRALPGEPLSGVVALVALRDERLIVLERSFAAGLPPFENRIYLIDISAAPDVAGVKKELASRPAASRLPKRLLWKGSLGVNLEGLALGPPLASGGRLLAAIADNGGTNVPTLLVTFRLTGP